MKSIEILDHLQSVLASHISDGGKFARENGRLFDPALTAATLTRRIRTLGGRRRTMTLRDIRLNCLERKITIGADALAIQHAGRSAEHARKKNPRKIFFHFLKLSKSPAISRIF